jgi:hypothetical protein
MKKLISLMTSILKFPLTIIESVKNILVSFANKLKSPYHSSTLQIRGFIHSVAIASIVFGGLYIFKPFGLETDSEANMHIIILGLLAFACMLVLQFFLPLVLKAFYGEHSWTLGKQFIQSFLMVASIAGISFYYLNNQGIANLELPLDYIKVLGFSILPLLLFVFLQEGMHTSKFKRKAEDLTSDLSSKEVISGNNPLKILAFEGSGQTLSLVPNQLIYAKVGKNQTEFFYQNILGVDKSEINIDEKKVLDELKDHPQFVSLNKGLYINTNAIHKITGNARGFEVAIARFNELIPVSSKFRKNLG